MEQQLKEVKKWGNSGGIPTPKEWIGKQVKVILVDRTQDIKKETLKILEPYLEDLLGVYLVGSHARKEQTKESDIDILAISKNTRKTIKSGKYEVEIIPLKPLLNLLNQNPIKIYPKFLEAVPIINSSLLEEIKSIKIDKKSLSPFIKESLAMLKTNKELIERDKKSGDMLKSYSVVYSCLLRLKALYLMNSILSKKKYSNRNFRKYLLSSLNIKQKQLNELYSIYKEVYLGKAVKTKMPLSLAESLIDLLEKELKKNG